MKRIPLTRTPPTIAVDLSNSTRGAWAPGSRLLARWAAAALRPRQRQARRQILSVHIVGTARSRRLNLRYRQKDRPTNVLSFAGAGNAPDGRFYLGELVICAPIVAQEARRDAKAVRAHWAHLTIHGVLHLLGFDHESGADAAKMSRREIQILDRLGFSDPYR